MSARQARIIPVDLLEDVLRELVNLRSTFEPATDPEACEELDALVAGVRQAIEEPAARRVIR